MGFENVKTLNFFLFSFQNRCSSTSRSLRTRSRRRRWTTPTGSSRRSTGPPWTSPLPGNTPVFCHQVKKKIVENQQFPLRLYQQNFFLERTVNILATPRTGSLNQCGGLKDPHHFILISIKAGSGSALNLLDPPQWSKFTFFFKKNA